MKQNKGGRKSKYETHVETRLFEVECWARDGLIDEQIANNLGVAYSTFREYVKKYSALSAALKKGKEVIDYEVENALLKRALGYQFEEVTKERIIDTGQKKRHNGESELTEKDWELIIAYFNGECCYCGSSSKLTKDHLNPLNNNGALVATNVVPSCAACNSSKKDNQWLKWYQKQKFYDKYKANKLQDYIVFAHTLLASKEEDIELGELVTTKIVTKEVQPDTTAQIFWLKNRKPKQWRDKQDIEHSGTMVNATVDLSHLSDEELEKALNKYGDE